MFCCREGTILEIVSQVCQMGYVTVKVNTSDRLCLCREPNNWSWGVLFGQYIVTILYISASFTCVHTHYPEMCVYIYICLFHVRAPTLHKDVCISRPLSPACTHITQRCVYICRPLSCACTHIMQRRVYI